MGNKINILVTGADGQMGSQFREMAAHYPLLQFTFTDKGSLPITDAEKVTAFFSSHSFEYCINCAAYTAVDKAESDQDAAFEVNAIAAANLALHCRKNNTVFIHISTDYVLDGTNSKGYIETDATNPINVYGASKLKGETLALNNHPGSIIIRTSWVYGVHGNNFVKSMLRLMREKDRIAVVNDQFGCPTYTADLAVAILHIITRNEQPQQGIYHFCNSGSTTWFEFATAIKLFAKSTCKVDPINTSEYPTAAKRPTYSLLDTEKIRQVFEVKTPYWKDSLQECVALLTG